MEMVLAIGGDEGNEEGLGVGELVVGEENGQKREKRLRGLGEERCMELGPFVEAEKCCGVGG